MLLIYRHGISTEGEAITTPYEAEERPKSYNLIDRSGKRRILKSNIGKLHDSYFIFEKYMYTLTDNKIPFITALIEARTKSIEQLTDKIGKLQQEKAEYIKLLEKEKERKR